MLSKADSSRKLWYKQPAQEWVEALPVGNGRLGAMVFGRIEHEVLQLNEDTLWSGRPRDVNNHQAYAYLDEVRRLIFAGQFFEAQQMIESKMLGCYTEAYQPLGNLYIDQYSGEISDYHRELDLENAIAAVMWRSNNALYTRKIFCSFPDQVLVVHFACDQPQQISFEVHLDSPHHFITKIDQDLRLILDGRCPVHTEPDYITDAESPVVYADEVSQGMRYRVVVQLQVEGGQVYSRQDKLVVSQADSATLILTATTSFNGFDRNPDLDGKDPVLLCDQILDRISTKDISVLMDRHVVDYQALFQRVRLDLGKPLYPGLPTDEWLARYRTHPDPALEALYFDYGRYLLIASSRPGCQPANLQGIWNDQVRPPWSSNFTLNINVEMNYWLAEVCDLPECHLPLFDMIDELVVTGSETARIHYNCRGWVVHHNVDIWRHAAPVGGSARWAFWPMGSAWLAHHLWEHYAFSGDKEFLRTRAYPAMKGAALFYLDWLISDAQDNLVTCPSTSPENVFITPAGETVAVSLASTMDMSLIWDLFTNCIQASRELGVDQPFRRELEVAKARLVPLRIGRYGQLQEWFANFAEAEPGHRHVSHLFGLYPGRQILKHQHEKLSQACAVSLQRRLANGGGHTGWSCAWLICLFARLEDAASAYEQVTTLLSRSTYCNLFDAHPPFQIDGNFGGTAGIAEMLLQSHADELSLLPALPSQWPCGSVVGLRARGGYTVGMQWESGSLTTAKIYAAHTGRCRVRYHQQLIVYCEGRLVPTTQESREVISFTAEAGKEYLVQRL